MRRYLEEVVNTGASERVGEFLSPEYAEVYEGARHPIGLDGAKDHVRGERETYPDLFVSVERQIAEGEWVATCLTARGPHRGAWMGMRPTGREVAITGVNVDRVVDGRIVEHGGAANLLEAFLRIGAVQAVGEKEQRSG